MPLSGEAIRLMNYIDDVAVTLRRVLATVPTLSAEERARVAEHLQAGQSQRRRRGPGPDREVQPRGDCRIAGQVKRRGRGPGAAGKARSSLPETVAIIGAGPLGRWLALAAARAGFSVLLEDVMPANLHHAQEWLREELGPEAAPEVAFVSTIEDAVREADLAIDCVPDELESKLEILWLLDRMAPPRTVLATPTTRLSIADLANCTYRPEKCIAIVAEAGDLTGNAKAGAAVLLRTTVKTEPQSLALLGEFWRRLGFSPVCEVEIADR